MLLVAGLVSIQCILFGPALLGTRILAATDRLVAPGPLGLDPRYADRAAENLLLLDPVEAFYPWLIFSAREIRAGRLPLWNPYSYCGSPLLANSQSAVFSPFSAIFYAFPDARSLAWIQLVKALLVGTGTYCFLRRVGVSGWGAIAGGWCFSICGFLVAWLSYPLSSVAVWLPWTFWAAEVLLERPRARAAIAVAMFTALTILSGHLETAAHVLSAAGLYGLWRWFEIGRGATAQRRAGTLIAGSAALLLGFGLAAVQLLPSAEYLETSLRIGARRHGLIDAAPTPSDSLPELVRVFFPYLFGTGQRGSLQLGSINFHEGGTNAYVGFAMLAALVPLGIVHGWRSSSTWCWVTLALVSIGPMFQIPLLNAWTHLPPFHLMNNNRALLIAAWCFVVLGARGLDAVRSRDRPPRGWAAAAMLLPIVCCAVFLWVARAEPARVLDVLAEHWPWYRAWLLRYVLITAALALGLFACMSARLKGSARAAVLGGVAVMELLVSAWGYNPQVEPDTFYPAREFIGYLRDQVGHGRVTGSPGTFSANISTPYELRDIRGYDAADPADYIRLLRAADPRWMPQPGHGITASFPATPSPILDLLGVQFVVSPDTLETNWERVAVLDGLQLYRNPKALPRAFIPRHTVHVSDPNRRLAMLSDANFKPRQLAIISEPGTAQWNPSGGSVEIVQDDPCRIVLDVEADTHACVVLADSWFAGWSVTVDGRPAEPLHANHALRAVQVSPGRHVVEWRYFPESVRNGLAAGALAGAALALWAIASTITVGRSRSIG